MLLKSDGHTLKKLMELSSRKLLNLNKPKKEGIMGYTNIALKDKISEMYPEIPRHGISVGLDFDTTKNAYIVKFKKDMHELTTHLEKKDADDCMNNVKCVYLGVQIGQLIKNFESTG